MTPNIAGAQFTGKKIAVLGFGVESQETVEFLIKHEAHLTVFDEKNEKDFDVERLRYLRDQGVRFEFGLFPSLTAFDCIVRSPGVKPGIEPLHEAGDLGITITSATNIFLENARGITVGITGTKGKGTTSALLYDMTKNAGRDVALGGNIGIPALSFFEKTKDNFISILELSSFQLMDASRSPHIAVVLMVTSDHLDFHSSTIEYATAKMGITRHQRENDLVVFNKDYPSSVLIADRSVGQRYEISRYESISQGCYIEGGFVMVAQKGHKEKIIETQAILIPGKHNWENVCASVMAAKLLSIPNEHIVETLKTFRGLTHRLELVREVDGVKYYNDSIATTPDSSIAAINAFDDPKILILGGSSKNSDFTELGKLIANHSNIKAVIGIGEEWSRIRAAIPNHPHNIKFIEDLSSMSEIVARAHAMADPDDVVILSPACASFDMFKDYKDRGDQFRREVEKL